MADQYWIIGGDGKEYGPVDLIVLAQWIRERRIVATSRVRKGEPPFAAAAGLPELAALFPSQPGTQPYAAPGDGGPGPRGTLPSEFRVWTFMGIAWDLVKPNWLILAAMSFILVAIGSVHYIGCLVQFIVCGPLMVGIWRAILGMIDGRKPAVGMMFEGFDRFGDAFLAVLVRGLLIALGFVCLIVPGIILALMWMFTLPILGETRLGFWEAMHVSAVLTEGYRWRLFLLSLAAIPIILLGLLALGVGVFFAAPIVMTALGLAYRFLQEKKRHTAPAA